MTKQNKGRKLFAVSASAALVASAIVPVASANADFTDASKISSWAKEAVEFFVETEVIKGYEDGSFKPQGTVTRAEAAKMFTVGLDLDTDSESDLTDISGHWAEEFINAVAGAEIVNGYEDGSFKPENKLTRAESAKMIVEALGFDEEGDVSDYTDVAGHWAEEHIALAVGAGVLNGKSDSVMDPDGSVTREEFATMLYRALEAADLIGDVEEPPVEVEAEIVSVEAINKTTVVVELSKEVDAVTSENFTIEGATVETATLAEDKKTVTLTVKDLAYSTNYTVAAKDIEVDGEATDFGTASFKTVDIQALWTLAIETKDASLKADGADNTEVTFKLLNANGQVDTNADNVVLDLNTTFGTLAQKRVTIQDGVATVLLTSEFSNTNVTAKIDAQIIEASGDYKELIGKVFGTQSIPFVTTNVDNVNSVTVVAAEANQADRVTLFFDKEVTVKHFVKTNEDGELLFAINGSGEFTADSDEIKKAKPETITHVLRNNSVIIDQAKFPKNFKIKGIKPLANNAKGVEVVLDKSTTLTDNADVSVTVNTVNSLNKVTKSSVDFKVTDARVPSATSVSTEGLDTLKVKYSEPIDKSALLIDGRHVGQQVDNVSQIEDAVKTTSAKFVYAFGEFNPATQEDLRDVATVKLTKNFKEDFEGAIAGYFGAGKHTVQASSTTDFAYATDKNNMGTTQNLTFTIAEDKAKPTADVTVESPEQFRVKFDKTIGLTAAEVKALFANGSAKVQVFDAKANEYVDTKAGQLEAKHLEVTKITGSEYVIELNTDWTVIYNTKVTAKNYYNDQYRIVIAKETVTNVANGLKNDQIVLDLNKSGSLLNAADVTSPVIADIKRVGTTAKFEVTMSEPVKLVVNGQVQDKAETSTTNLDTQAQDQSSQATTTVQFLGTDKNGKAVTFNGVVNGYKDKAGQDQLLDVQWTAMDMVIDGKEVKAVTPQYIVDQGGSSEWTIVVRAIADDVGNTASSATAKFNLEKSNPKNTPFFIDTKEDANGNVIGHKVYGYTNGAAADTVEITFSEGVRWTDVHDATNPAQYTLNGKTLPEGTSIRIADDSTATHATAAGYEKVIITLPDGTLNNLTNESNVITVNKNLTSYDGSVITGTTEVTFTADGQTPPPVYPNADQQAAINAVNTAVTAVPATITAENLEDAKTKVAAAKAAIADAKAKGVKAEDLTAAETKVAAADAEIAKLDGKDPETGENNLTEAELLVEGKEAVVDSVVPGIVTITIDPADLKEEYAGKALKAVIGETTYDATLRNGKLVIAIRGQLTKEEVKAQAKFIAE